MKKKLFTAMIAFVLAVVTPVSILSGCQKSNPTEEYIALESNAMHEMINDAFDNAEPAADIHTTATVDVTLADALFEVLGNPDLNWIDKVSFAYDLHQNDSLIQALANVGMNDKPLFSFEGITNPLSGITYMAIPTISEYYMKMQQSSVPTADLEEMLSMLNTPETETVRKLLIKYVDIALNSMVNIEKSSEELVIKGQTQKVTVYTNYITGKVLIDALKAILTEAKKDSDLKAIFPAEVNFEASIDELIASLETANPSTDKEEALVITTYADKDDNVLGRKFSADNLTISHISLPTSTGSVSETFLGNEQANYRLEGSNTASGSTYTLFITSAGQAIEVGTVAITGDKNDGACTVTLSDFLEQNMFGSTDADITLTIQWKLTDKSADIDFYLSLMSQELIAVNITTSQSEAKDVTAPDDHLSADNPEDEQVYLDSIDTYELMNNMLAIGFPSEYIDAVLNYLEGTPVE